MTQVFRDPSFPLFAEHARLDSNGFRLHSHEFIELVVISNGCGVHIADDKRYPISAGDVFVLQGHQVHGFEVESYLELSNVMASFGRLPLPLHYLRSLPGYHALFVLEPMYRQRHQFRSRLTLKPDDLSRVMSLVSQLETELGAGLPGYEALSLSLLVNIVVMLSRLYSEHHQQPSQDLLRLGSVMTALETDFSTDWRLERLAQMAHLSVNQLLRVFKSATGYTPVEYLTRIRVLKAAELLGASDATTIEVALAVGFSDSSYFCRRFKHAMGLTPGEYRRRMEKRVGNSG